MNLHPGLNFFFLEIIFLIEAGPKEMIVFEEEKISRGSFKPEIRLLGKKKKVNVRCFPFYFSRECFNVSRY